MTTILVDKLLESFKKLEACISTTKDVLEQKSDVPEQVISRVNQYFQIVSKQKGFAEELKRQIELGNWSEVERHMRLINGLSSMIREDAEEILAGLSDATPMPETEPLIN